MRTEDLVRQGKLVAPLLANQQVAFVGDMDGTASLLGLIAINGGPSPAGVHLLDFDDRVLQTALRLAEHHGFASLLSVHLCNCFDPVPPDLLGEFDWFYINPPYGSQNEGASARLFLTRGCELVRQRGGSGCMILPDDISRPWTRSAICSTQEFLLNHDWEIREKVDFLHRYFLDDDPDLASSLFVVDQIGSGLDAPMPFAGRRVGANEIPNFYGRNTLPPYPKSINQDGVFIGAVAA
jgi:hypothetical protein